MQMLSNFMSRLQEQELQSTFEIWSILDEGYGSEARSLQNRAFQQDHHSHCGIYYEKPSHYPNIHFIFVHFKP